MAALAMTPQHSFPCVSFVSKIQKRAILWRAISREVQGNGKANACRLLRTRQPNERIAGQRLYARMGGDRQGSYAAEGRPFHFRPLVHPRNFGDGDARSPNDSRFRRFPPGTVPDPLPGAWRSGPCGPCPWPVGADVRIPINKGSLALGQVPFFYKIG